MYGDIAGWTGAILILLGYTLLSFEWIKQTDWRYHLTNFIGSIGLATDCLIRATYPAAVLNIVFTTIALVALFRFIRRDLSPESHSAENSEPH